MKVSDCCGADPILNSEDVGLCPQCKEHCEYIDLEAPEAPQSHPLDGDIHGQIYQALFTIKCALNHAMQLVGKLEQTDNNQTNESI